jgi:hypothetical protein
VAPGEADAYHFCGHTYTTASCPHPTGLPRVDARGYPLRASDGSPVDNLGRAVDAAGRPVDALDGHLAWEEAMERELPVPGPIAIPAGTEEEPVAGGTIVRSWEGLEGRVESSRDPVAPGLSRLTVRVTNTTSWAGEGRQQALRRALVSTHVALHVEGGAFVSLTDPPEHVREHAEACRNVGTWPVLVGDRSTMLSAPIILEDFPRIAPESPGDLFDGGEIDQLLILNILSLSEEERNEMRASDPRAREILERCSALGREELMSLHGRWSHDVG